jgi:hypothetical protein
MGQVEVIRETIRRHAIPRSTVAKLSGLWLTDLSAWLNGKRDLAPDRIARVQEAITDILNVLAVFPFADLRDPEKVRKMIVAVNDAILQHGLFDEAAPETTEPTQPDLDSLRMRTVQSS